MDKLQVFICENFYLEYQEALKREGIDDIELRIMPTLCDHKGRTNETEKILFQAGRDPSVLICSQFCDALKHIPEDGFVEAVTGNYCFTHLICDEYLDYLIAQGSYIISSGWLKQWKQHLAAMGFNRETARCFFQEASKQIVLLDAKIDDQAEDLLGELSAYLGLPYTVIPIKLETIRLLLRSKIVEWRYYHENIEKNSIMNELRHRSADNAAVFDMIGRISSHTSTREVISKMQELFVLVFGAKKLSFWSENSEQAFMVLSEFKSKEANFFMLKDENRFCIKVSWDDKLYGIIDASGFIVPQHIDRYLNLALELSKFLGLVFHNHEQYKKIVKSQEEANAKSRYFAHMNHEIRTPLNGFMGFLQLMDDTSLNQQQQMYMLYMKQTTKHMLSIINNVLDMTKIEAGEMKLSNCIFDLEEEIKTALAPLYSLAKQKNIHLQLTTEGFLPRQVEGDPDRFRQILLNLGGNAVKFTQEGQVNIIIQCLETTEKHHALELVVEDTGPGMTQESLDKLFLPFYQIDDGVTPQSKGTGLGMTITQELVELMGGQIKVESAPGRGTRAEVNVKLLIPDSLGSSIERKKVEHND